MHIWGSSPFSLCLPPRAYSGCFALCVRLINEVKQRLGSVRQRDELNSLLSPFLSYYQ